MNYIVDISAPSLLLAQGDGPSLASQPAAAGTTAPGAAGAPAGAPPKSGFADFIFLAGMGVLLALIISSMLGARREKKRMDEMMNSMKKHDQVRTVGGIIGSVVEIKPDVVIIKVDESTGAKVTVMRSKIEAVIPQSTSGSA